MLIHVTASSSGCRGNYFRRRGRTTLGCAPFTLPNTRRYLCIYPLPARDAALHLFVRRQGQTLLADMGNRYFINSVATATALC